MAKRPSIIDQALAASVPAHGGTVVAVAPAIEKAAPKRAPREDMQHTSVYIPRGAHDRLREIAFTERCKVHDLIMQGLDKVLEQHGHSERATRSTTALQHDGATARQHDSATD